VSRIKKLTGQNKKFPFLFPSLKSASLSGVIHFCVFPMIQVQVVGLVDSKAKLEKLMHACRGICGRSEQKLLHRETVYKLPNQPVQSAGQRSSTYEIRYRLGKIATSEPDKFVQPMSLIYIGDHFPLPRTCEKIFDADAPKRVPKPTIRKVIEVRRGGGGGGSFSINRECAL
jgi:hypothetical protein